MKTKKQTKITVTTKEAAEMVTYVEKTSFLGSQMANTLLGLMQEGCVPPARLGSVQKTVDRWDATCKLRLTNPISMMEREKELFPNG